MCVGTFLSRWSYQKEKDAEAVLQRKTDLLKHQLDSEGPHNVAMIKRMQEEGGLMLEQTDLK